MHKTFNEIDLNDKFFDSLKTDYPDFEDWYIRKRDQDAFVQYNEAGNIEGFLYLKIEENAVKDVHPYILGKRILKVGTFKIDSHGTRLGEQFIKILVDYAINEKVDLCYVTIFPKHEGLINLIKRFGFFEYGEKGKGLFQEKVFVKDMKLFSGNIYLDYPLVKSNGAKKYLLSIYPKYHSVMFPDSILTTENKNIIKDISYTNSIHKIYVCTMKVDILKYGDIVVLYRTAEIGKNAEYSAVATSICLVEEVKMKDEFESFDEFFSYANQYSVFDRDDLHYWYNRGNCNAIKLTYNAALKKRIVRHDLIEKVGLERNMYWGFFPISDDQFDKIIICGEVNSNIIL